MEPKVKKTTRKYTRKEDAQAMALAAAGQQPLAPTSGRAIGVGPTIGGGGVRGGKKKRGGIDPMDGRTIVASNPFDDDQPVVLSHQHQVHQHPAPMHLMPPSSGPLPPPPPMHHHHGMGGPMITGPPLSPAMMHGGPPPPTQMQAPPYGGGPAPPPMHQAHPPNSYLSPPPPPQQMEPNAGHQTPGSGTPPGGGPQYAQVMAYCGECNQAIYANEAKMVCQVGCDTYYHRRCSGLSDLACELLLREQAAEWACNRCICSDRKIPVVRTIPQQQNNQPPLPPNNTSSNNNNNNNSNNTTRNNHHLHHLTHQHHHHQNHHNSYQHQPQPPPPPPNAAVYGQALWS